MRMNLRGMAGALLLAVIGDCGCRRPLRSRPGRARAGRSRAALGAADSGRAATFPLAKRVSLGPGKSVLVQFPFELKDVLVSDPEKVDAVVQSSNRVFLIAKKAGPDQRLLLRHQGTADPDAGDLGRRRPRERSTTC